jgi:hypothetical protein
MRVRGRGVTVAGEKMPWFFNLEEVEGVLKGYFRVDGWETSRAMNQWYENNAGQETEVYLEGFGKALVKPLGIFIHESGHYNESEIRLACSLL